MAATEEESRGPPRGPRRRRQLAGLWVAVAIGSLVVRLGFPRGPDWSGPLLGLDLALLLAMGIDLARSTFRASDDGLAARIRGRWFDWMVALLGVATLLVGPSLSLDEALVLETRELGFSSLLEGVVVGSLVLLVVHRLLRSQEWILAMGLPPVFLLAASFLALVGIGTLLLLVPRAAADPENPLGLVEALFTATSAACVTGLAVFDVGPRLSAGGEVVLLFLIQLGGLGIVAFVVTLSVLAGRDLSVPQLQTLKEMVNASALADVKTEMRDIVALAAAAELVGAILLFFTWPHAPEAGLLHRAWSSLFHAVSAFCNAGFTLTRSGLAFADRAPIATVVVMALIVFGGLGFPVVRDLVRRDGKPRALQTTLVLRTSLALVVAGGLGYWLLEGGSLLVAVFQSVTSRTAGFSAVPTGELQDATLILLVFLMAIGAGPISTGGGIKTATFAVLLSSVRAMLNGRDRVEIRKRTLPAQAVQAALSVFVLYVLASLIVTFLLSVFEPGVALRDLAFESVSALSTVGLSTGITPTLGTPALLVLCAAMFLGRVGPLTLAMVIFGRRRKATSYDFPVEDVIIG